MSTIFTKCQARIGLQDQLVYDGSFTLAKVVDETVGEVTQSNTYFDHVGWHNTDRIISISCCAAQGGQGKYCFVSLVLVLSRILRQCKHSLKGEKRWRD